MKNNNTNNTATAQAMAQAMAQGNMVEVMQALMAQAMQAGMAQGIMAGKAQAQQAQAMGNGDAGKAQAVRLPQGKGKAQAMQAQDKAQAQGIEWISCKRKEEKELIGNLRDALVQGKETDALSCIKAWHVMVNKDKKVSDSVIIALYRNLCKVAFDGKYATVKGTKDACMVCKSCGRIKAWLYTFNRGNVKIIG